VTVESEAPDPERLQRHLRALSAVNRQLQAQLEDGSWAPIKARRASVGSEWLRQLRRQQGAGKPFLVHTPTKGVFVVEGALRREVMSGLLAAALTRVLGPMRALADDEIAQWSEGPPVAVLEGGTGRPFVVVGGRRLPLRGLPLPYPVKDDEMLVLPVGEELRFTSGVRSGPSRVERTRALVAHEGPKGAAAAVLGKIARRIRGAGTH
jgi:hypothetical protein